VTVVDDVGPTTPAVGGRRSLPVPDPIARDDLLVAQRLDQHLRGSTTPTSDRTGGTPPKPPRNGWSSSNIPCCERTSSSIRRGERLLERWLEAVPEPQRVARFGRLLRQQLSPTAIAGELESAADDVAAYDVAADDVAANPGAANPGGRRSRLAYGEALTELVMGARSVRLA
jgi:hypothetical protein